MSERSSDWDAGQVQRKECIVSIGASPASLAAADRAEAAVELDLRGRWDALDLSGLLVPFHSFLLDHATDRWVVYTRAPGCHGESLGEALRPIVEWCAERRLDAPVRVQARAYGGS
jgi:hypothetical protein